MQYPGAPETLAGEVFDSHCHLDIGLDDDGPLPVADALAAAAAVGVPRVVQIGCDLPSARWSVQAARDHAPVVAAVSLHPNEAPRIQAEHGRAALEDAWAEIDALAADPRVRAVGETGLDFFRTPEGVGRDVQEESFRRHIALAKQHGKALVIHDRDAHDAVVRVLLDEGAPEQVVFHCFSGGPKLAGTCSEHGWVMSFAGNVTFKNAEELRAALRVAPLELLLVETDAPFLTPVPYRGRPNASYLVPLTLRAMAAELGVGEGALAASIRATGQRVFGLW
jgi:TatD DNase family protein